MVEQKIFHHWNETGIDLHGRTTGNVKTQCPKCSESRKNKRDKCLSVDLQKKVWNCHNCAWSGGIMEEMQNKASYVRPEPRNQQFGERVEQWFKSRSISKETLEYFRITESVEFMPQTDKKSNCINFNYYRDKELVNIKFRDGAKNFKMVSKAELVFYNLDAIRGKDECIICEGEVDCMSLYEASLFNAVSVPNGASKGNAKLEYLDNCWPYFQHMKKVVIATDGDEAGLMLREELARRIGKEVCYFIEYPEGCKDANEILLKYGKEKLNQTIRAAKQYPIEGVFTADDFRNEIEYILKHGYPKTQKIGHEGLDKLITWREGEITTITGTPGAGKSEVVDDILCRLAAQSGWRFGVCSPEKQPSTLHIIGLMKKYVGLDVWGNAKMNEFQRNKAIDFINEHFYFMAIEEISMTIDGILAKAAELVLRYGIKGLLIDPWNYIEHKIPNGYTETQYISEALTKVKSFVKKYGVHVFLIAHPTKVQKDKKTGQYEVPNLYSISGSSHFFNKTDNGMVVWRDYQSNEVFVYVQKIRFTFVGKIGYQQFKYDPKTGRYAEPHKDFDVLLKDASTQIPVPLAVPKEREIGQFTPISELLKRELQPVEEEDAPF